jgi:Uma2 family endonuclease
MSGSDAVRPAQSRIRLTHADFELFPEDGKRHELIDGEHYVTPSPNTRHQTVALNLAVLIGNYLDAHPVGRLFMAPFDVVLTDVDVVEPDLVYVSLERVVDVLTPKHVRGAPDLVAEIGSTSTRARDETIKRRLYERAGVPEYWYIDPDVDMVRVYRREGDHFARPSELSRESGDVLATALLPGLEMPLVRIFRE